MSAYNSQEYIRMALDSVLSQTYKNFEMIIVDDGSTDKTVDIIRSEYLHDARMHLLVQKNQGIAATRNNAIRKAKGELIAFLDSDDYYLPDKLQKEVDFLAKHQEFDIVYCGTKHFYENRPDVLYSHQGQNPSGDVFGELLKYFFGQLDTILIPKRIFDKVGLFDENFRDSEELDLYFRIARAGFTFGFLNEDLVRIMIRKTSLSRYENQWKMKEHILQVFEQLNNEMNLKDRQKYNMESKLKNLKFKLGIAYLIAEKKKEAVNILKNLRYSLIGETILKSFIIFIYVIPASFLKFLFGQSLRLKHRLLFRRVN